MLKNTFKKNKGITLIALVVTIIVLLILAGISIAMLTGQNGILNRAAEAKEKTEIAQEDENQKLQGYEDIINQYAPSANSGNLPTGEGTTPYLPNNTFTKKEGDLSTGLVIQDANQNEYVWVEVPTTIYDNAEYNSSGAKKPSDSENYANIEACLKAYTVNYVNSDYSDTNSSFTEQYQAMLKSVYTNGGFGIGRYEAGIEGDTPRTSDTELTSSDKVVIKQNRLPWIYVTRDEAKTLAEKMNYGDCKGSLIFGIQWDLTLKYIEEKTVELAEEANKDTVRTDIKSKFSDSTTIGNYKNNLWNITNANAKYSENSGSSFTAYPKPKTENASILLTTGADTSFSLMNIYDIAGNVREWTLEFYNTSGPCVVRGGSYVHLGSYNPAKDRNYSNASHSNSNIGFRVGLWK